MREIEGLIWRSFGPFEETPPFVAYSTLDRELHIDVRMPITRSTVNVRFSINSAT